MSQPHASSFETATNNFALSGPLSEWLFAARFWQEASAAVDISLDQYEDEEVRAECIDIIIEMLESRIDDLSAVSERHIDFCYAWTSTGQPLISRIESDVAQSELKKLVSFMRNARSFAAVITFSL